VIQLNSVNFFASGPGGGGGAGGKKEHNFEAILTIIEQKIQNKQKFLGKD
jgi:hypothetical protein